MDTITFIKQLPSEVALGTGMVLAVMCAAFLFLYFIHFLISAAGYSRMFTKAGTAGWKAFIPFLNDYHHFKLAWNGKLFIAYLVLMLATLVLTPFNGVPAQTLAFAAAIASTVMLVILQIKTAKAYGKGAGFGLLMLLLPVVGAPILGFGKAAYAGKQ